MQGETVTEILSVAQKHNIPLYLSVIMLFKSKGVSVQDLSTSIGCHRNTIPMALRGAFMPSEGFINRLSEELGVNPWNYAPESYYENLKKVKKAS